MLRQFTRPARLRPMRHRIAALAVFVVQLAVAGSALWEPRTEVRLDNHVEQDGARHLDVHNEATCLLCSARAQTSLPTLAEPPLDAPLRAPSVVSPDHAVPAASDPSPTRSRAPPSRPA